MSARAGAITRRWRAWHASGRQARVDVLAFAVLVPVMHVAVRVIGYHRTATWTSRRVAVPAPAVTPDAIAARGAAAIRALRRHGIIRGNCLSRSLALLWWLERRGVTADLRFGVRTRAGALEAHAWIERDGTPLTDPLDVGEQFTPLASRPSA